MSSWEISGYGFEYASCDFSLSSRVMPLACSSNEALPSPDVRFSSTGSSQSASSIGNFSSAKKTSADCSHASRRPFDHISIACVKIRLMMEDILASSI